MKKRYPIIKENAKDVSKGKQKIKDADIR